MSRLTSLVYAVFVAIVFAVPASAKSLDPFGPYFEASTCAIGDVSGGAVDCYGTITGGNSNAQQVDPNNALFNNTQGLFAMTGWKDVYASSSSGATFGNVKGTFNVAWDLSGAVAVMLKFGNTWAAYLYNGLSAGTYSYDLSGMGKQALSNFRIIQTSPVPVPAALPLLAGGLGLMVMVGRRRRKQHA